MSGIFFKEQAIAVAGAGVAVGVVHPELRPLHRLSGDLIRKNHFQSSVSIEEQIPTYRRHGWNLFPRMDRMKMRFWVHCLCGLAQRYMRERGRPHLLHAHSAIWGGVAARVLSQRHSIPYVLTEHQTSFLNGRGMPGTPGASWVDRAMGDVFGHASAVIPVSAALKQRLSKYVPGGSEKVFVIPNFVDSEFFSLPRSTLPSTPFRLFSLGNLVRRKNTAFLLQTFAEFLAYEPSTLLEIGGDGPERPHLEALIQTLGIAHNVRLLGQLSRLGVKEALHRAHAFVLPSTEETFAIVLIEAMSTGIPVIATRCGGPEDIVTDDTGNLVDVNDRDALIRAMVFVKNNASAFDADRIRQSAIRRFGQERVVGELLAVYDACRTG